MVDHWYTAKTRLAGDDGGWSKGWDKAIKAGKLTAATTSDIQRIPSNLVQTSSRRARRNPVRKTPKDMAWL